MECLKIRCKSALHQNSHKAPCAWDLNVYRGCSHGCRYCYAIYSHEYINDQYFFDRVYCKTNLPEILEKELSSKSWKKYPVNLGGVTDSYQKAEEEMKIMPSVLHSLAKHRTPAILLTKSDLILRDIESLQNLRDSADMKISITVTTMNEHLSSILEPGAPSPQRRMEAVRKLREAGISAGVSLMPVIPFLTDGKENLESIFDAAASAGAEFLRTNLLFLIGKTKDQFLNFAESYDPQLSADLRYLYAKGNVASNYAIGYKHIIAELKEKYTLPPWTPMRFTNGKQKSLLDF